MKLTPIQIAVRDARWAARKAGKRPPHVDEVRGKTAEELLYFRDKPGSALLWLLQTRFKIAQCTQCFTGILRGMDNAGVIAAMKDAQPYAFSVLENAKEMPHLNAKIIEFAQKDWTGLVRLVNEACDLASFGTDVKRHPSLAEPATFVYLLHLAGSNSNPKGEELRYSMRSVEANYNGDARFVVVGAAKPDWYTGEFWHRPRIPHCDRQKYRDTLRLFHELAQSDDLPDEYIWIADDCYFSRAVALQDLRVPRYQGSINAPDPRGSGTHAQVKRDTYGALRSEGRPRIDTATHLPHVIHREKWLQVWDEYRLDRHALLWEPLYAALHHPHPRKVERQFFHRINATNKDTPHFKAHVTNNAVRGWTTGLHVTLRKMFPQPTRYESFHMGGIDLIDGEATSPQRRIRKLGLDKYEPATQRELQGIWSTLPQGFTFLDVGCNCGLYSCLCAVARPDAEIIGFDPTPETIAVARRIADRNAFPIRYEQLALSDTEGTGTLYISDRSEASNSLREGFRQAVGTVEVRTTTLDAYCESNSIRPDVIKIDVETFEAEVLRGGRNTIHKCQPYIIAEERPGEQPDKLLSALPEGYTARVMVEDEPRENWLLSPHLKGN